MDMWINERTRLNQINDQEQMNDEQMDKGTYMTVIFRIE